MAWRGWLFEHELLRMVDWMSSERERRAVQFVSATGSVLPFVLYIPSTVHNCSNDVTFL